MKQYFLVKFLARILLILGITSLLQPAIAMGPHAISLSTIQINAGSSVLNIAKIIGDVAIVAGVGFALASFFKFHQHKLNPTQVPISQGITLLLIGSGLMLFPIMLPTATKAAFGTTSLAKTSGGAIASLIK